MNGLKQYIVMFLLMGCLAQYSSLHAQTSGFSYQVLLEVKGEYSNLYKDSEINPDNRMKIDDFSSVSKLYPILGFAHNMENSEIRLQTEGLVRNYNLDKDSTDFSFEELYLQYALADKHFFVLGKKRLDWGTGMIWNPTNFFVQKDPLRTQNRLEGIFMLSYAYLLKNGAVGIYVFPEKKAEECSFAVKYDYTGNRIDASLSFLEYGRYQQFGCDVSYGGDIFTVYSEGVIKNFDKTLPVRKRFHTEIVVGGSVNLNSNISFRGEYRFRETADATLYDPISVSKHSLYGSLDYADIYDRWSVSLRTFHDPVSRQLMVSPVGVWKPGNFQVELSAMIYNHSLAIYNFQSSLLVSYYF